MPEQEGPIGYDESVDYVWPVVNDSTGRIEFVDGDGNVVEADLLVKGAIHADGSDFEAAEANGQGLILKDKTTGHKRKIVIDNSTVDVEDVA